MSDAPRLQPCKLCGKTAYLHVSHIMPRWAHRRVLHLYATPTERQPVLVRDGIAIFSGAQHAELMLCTACEERFKRWEDYVAAISVQEDDRFPARDAVVPNGPVRGDAGTLDCPMIARFAVSVIWRASASTQFSAVTLGAYVDDFARYLLNDDTSLPESARLLLELFHMRGHPPATRSRGDHAIVAPGSWRYHGHRDHRFACFGMWFSLSVGGILPAGLDAVCLARSRCVFLGDGARHLEAVDELLGKTRPRGKLARRGANGRR